MARRLAREEGLFVAIFPDGGERYLSTDLFTDRTQSNLKIFNTMTREKTAFKSIRPDEVLMHSCGPTVYEVPHIGNFRRFIVSDLIRRYFEYQGCRVRHVTNIIDLDDRSIRGAEQANVDLTTYTEKGTTALLDGLRRLNMRPDDEYPRASGHFEEMVRLVEKLVQTRGMCMKS